MTFIYNSGNLNKTEFGTFISHLKKNKLNPSTSLFCFKNDIRNAVLCSAHKHVLNL